LVPALERELLTNSAAYAFKNFETPPCFEHANLRVAACEYSPFLQSAIAPVESLSSGRAAAVAAGAFAFDFSRAGELAGTAAGRLGVVAGVELLTPPWLEHAPRPALLVVPSVHVTSAFFAAAVAFASTPP
jgi:hypothetical protein